MTRLLRGLTEMSDAESENLRLRAYQLASLLTEAAEPHLLLKRLEPLDRRAYQLLASWQEACGHPDPGVAPEIDLARGRLEALLELGPPERLRAVEQEPHEFCMWGVARLALIHCAELDEASSVHELAQLAAHVAERLPSEFYGLPHVAELRALAAVEVARARLLGFRVAEALAALDQAQSLAAAGSGILDVADYLESVARLLARLSRVGLRRRRRA